MILDDTLRKLTMEGVLSKMHNVDILVIIIDRFKGLGKQFLKKIL